MVFPLLKRYTLVSFLNYHLSGLSTIGRNGSYARASYMSFAASAPWRRIVTSPPCTATMVDASLHGVLPRIDGNIHPAQDAWLYFDERSWCGFAMRVGRCHGERRVTETDQLLYHRRRRCAQCNRAVRCAHEGWDSWSRRHNKGEGAGPECRGKVANRLRHINSVPSSASAPDTSQGTVWAVSRCLSVKMRPYPVADGGISRHAA